MKKFLAILAVAGVFAACNSGSDESKTGDTTLVDTTTVSPVPSIDTTGAASADSANKAAADTTKK